MRTIKVKVYYYGLYSVVTGIDAEKLEIPEHTHLRSFIYKLVDKYGDSLGKLLFDEFNEPWDDLIIAVNDDSIFLPSNDCELMDGDVVRLLYPIVGG